MAEPIESFDVVTFGVLGPLRAEDERGPLALKGPRHRAVLARLLIARGRVVPTTQLIDDLWDEPPADPTGTLQTFVSALRRIIEPGRAPRQPAQILITAAPGYALRIDPAKVDAGRFEALVRQADSLRTAAISGRPADPSSAVAWPAGPEQASRTRTAHPTPPELLRAAVAEIDTALELWQGPAYAEFADRPWARAEITRLGELRLTAMEQRAGTLLDLGRDAEVITTLDAVVHDHPLRETAWHTLVLALYRSGRQADALAALRTLRRTLRDELGVDPGIEMRDLESAILTQAPHLTSPAVRSATLIPGAAAPPAPAEPRGAPAPHAEAPTREVGSTEPNSPTAAEPRDGRLPDTPPRSSDPGDTGASEPAPAAVEPLEFDRRETGSAMAEDATTGASLVMSERRGPDGSAARGFGTGAEIFVGRVGEISRLDQLAAEVAASGRVRVVLVSGAEGAGKSALARVFSDRLAARGWVSAWGASPEEAGTPGNWPWQRMVADLVAAGRPEPARSGAEEADPVAARFAARQRNLDYLGAASAGGPVVLVFDDLHRARAEALELLVAVASSATVGRVLAVGTYRTTEVGPELTAALGRVARVEPERIQLGGLSAGETGELVGEVVGTAIDAGVVRRIHERGSGNPFFTRELARLLRDEGNNALAVVPAGVRDVVRHRLTRLAEPHRTVLQQAAVVGAEVDPDLVVLLTGDEELVLAALDAALHAGFLSEHAHAGGATVRTGGLVFAHDVVREVVYGEVSSVRRAAWHARVGELMEERGGDAAVLAHHFGRAGTAATAEPAARYARAAALQAEVVFAPHEAVRWWEQAVAGFARIGDVRAGLEASMGLGRALAVTGELERARRLRGEAIQVAEGLGDSALTGQVIVAFDVPAVWTENDDPVLAGEIVDAAYRVLGELPPAEVELRCRLLATIALELRGDYGGRGPGAAMEAESLARQSGRPELLALALNARYMQTFYRAGLAGERDRIGAELIALSREAELVTFEVLGHLIRIQGLSATADFGEADKHAAAADALADRYELPLVGVFTRWYRALRQSLTAPYAESEAAYRVAAASFPLAAMPGLGHGLLPLALSCLRLRHNLPIAPDPGIDWGPHEPWVRPLLLLAEDRRPDARKALRALPDPPPDLLLELRLCLLARAALELDERDLIARLHDELLPAAGELAGAATGMLTLEPIADYLVKLAAER
ncbi:BTAD domain-containing putative transcriptional regulator [Nocardia sp. NPDC020380]|uniref:BTAD domain-containing putative transcriptional regulator n=1 Tax=Nocardia sp. NPDC020380 TaxID=3364309 RepID=UPI00378F8661